MKTMQDFPSVVGLGEIGLDRAVSSNLWRKQVDFFVKLFSLVRQERNSDPSFPTIWINGCAHPVHADITKCYVFYFLLV